MSEIHRSVFLKEIKTQFPELKEILNGQEGLFFREVGVFLEYVQRHIDEGDRASVQLLLERTDRYYRDGNKALREFVRNGICEDLQFEDTKDRERAWALQFLSPSLKRERDSWIGRMGSWARK